MFFLKIILVLYLLKGCFCHVSNLSQNNIASQGMSLKLPNVPQKPKNSTIDANKKKPGFRFRLPFMDMELQNQRNVHIMQERLQKQQIYVIHGNELYQMFVGHNEKRLAFVGHLGGSLRDNEPLGAEIIDLREFLIMVIALEEHLEVYQLSEQILESRAQTTKDPKQQNETAPIFEPIQQISLPGRYRQHFLTDPSNEHIMLIVGINFTKLYGRLHTFIWANSYFDPVEELTVPPIHALYVMGTYPKYLVRGRAIKHQAKTIITVGEIQSTTMTLHTTQTLTVNSQTIHSGSFHGKHYLIACSNKQKQCNSFRMGADSGQFSVYKQRLSKDLAFDKFSGGQHFLVASRKNEISVFTSGRLDCYASFKTNESDITSIMTLVNAHGEDFILLNYKRPFRMLIRMVELEAENGGLLGTSTANASELEDTSALFRHRHMFEETIGTLRSLLLRRRNAMNTFHKASMSSSTNSTKLMELNLANPVRVHRGEIKTVRLVGQHLRSPLQLLQRVSALRQRFSSNRFRRDTANATNLSSIRVKNVTVKNLLYENSVLPGFHLDKLAKPSAILSVRPKITTHALSTKQLLTRHKLRVPRENDAPANSSLNLENLKQLNVSNINGIAWQDFYENLYLKNRDTTIKGRLILQTASNITHLTTKTLNGLVVDDFFNLHKPQSVDSNILFSGFLIKNLTAETVNGLDFAEDLVFQNTESFIETPVNIYQISIAKDLLMSDNITIERTPSDAETEFKQHYTGKVIINGTLTVKNLTTEQASRPTIFLGRRPFSFERIKQKYLLHNEPQQFISTFIFGNAKVTVPSLKTQYLNDNPTEDHLLNNPVSTQAQPLSLIFMNVKIEGDLVLVQAMTRIANLSRNAVRQNDVANITGTKIFEAPLTVDDVMTLTLNEMPVSDLVLKSQLKHSYWFKDTKSFDRIDVEQDLRVDKALNISKLNNLPLRNLLSADYHFERLQVPKMLEATNLVFHKINGTNFDQVFENFRLHEGELLLHKKLIIEGSLKFSKNLNVTNINELDWQTYQADLVRVNEDAEIAGEKCFLKELTITNALEASNINNVALEKLFERLLSKSKPQVITGYYAFGDVRFSNLDVEFINDVPVKEFIDMRAESVTINSDLVVPKLTVLGDVKSNDNTMQESLQNLTHKISLLAAQKWHSIFVTDNAYWNDKEVVDATQQALLDYIYKNAVQRTSQQVISGNVKFVRPLIAKMTTKTAFPKNFDLDFIAKDCVLKHAEHTQIITAEKTFLLPLQLHSVEVKTLLDTHLLNGIEVLRFNDSLYRLSSKMPIVGPLKFLVPPTIEKMSVEKLVNGISTAKIYHNISVPLPPLKVRRLVFDEALQIDQVNGESLDYLLENHLTKNDALPQGVAGYINFQHLVLNEKNRLQTVNDVHVENLVFKKSKQLQSIMGTKTFERDLQLKGPVHVMQLNGRDITDSYQKTIFKNRDYEYDNLNVQTATFEKGLILIRNSDQIDPTVGTALAPNSTSAQDLALSLQRELAMISDEVDKQNDGTKSLLYLDEPSNWQITCSKPNASIHKSYSLPSKRTSLCERHFQNVQISYAANETAHGNIFLSNFTSNFVTAIAYDFAVKAENYCEHKYRKVKSKITITTSGHTRIIGLKKYIENIFIYKPKNNHSDILLLIHEIEFAHNRHEVRIISLPKSPDQNVTDLQSLTYGIGKSVRLFDFVNFTALISGDGIINNRPALAIYHFNSTISQFQFTKSITGDFDVFELLLTAKAPLEFHLLLSCTRCHQIQIYTLKPELFSSTYEIFQLITLKTSIDRIQPFRLKDGALYMLLLGEHGREYYYLYRYTQLQGWLHTTYGYFENTEMVIPLYDDQLLLDEHNLLVLLCNSNLCKLIKAVLV